MSPEYGNLSDLDSAYSVLQRWNIDTSPIRRNSMNNYWTLNEPGFRERLSILESPNVPRGGVVGVAAPDRFLQIVASHPYPTFGVHIDINRLFTEVAFPYYSQGILESGGSVDKFHQYLNSGRKILEGLFEVWFEKHKKLSSHHNPVLSVGARINMISEASRKHSEYFGLNYWMNNQKMMNRLYSLASLNRLKSVTGDICTSQTWDAVSEVTREDLKTGTSVLDVSNIHQTIWAGLNLQQQLKQIFDPSQSAPWIFASSHITYRNGYSKIEDIAHEYASDPDLSQYYRNSPWENHIDNLDFSYGQAKAWVSKGIWILVPKTSNPNKKT